MKRFLTTLLCILMVVALIPTSDFFVEKNTAYAGGETQEPALDYLCFTANTDGSTVKLMQSCKNPQVNLEYTTDSNTNSTEDVTWNSYEFGSPITLTSATDKVFFRASDTNSTSWRCNCDEYKFELTGSIAASGNIMSLLYSDISSSNVSATMIPCNGCFDSLFDGCAVLTQAPTLPAMTLTDACYSGMFRNCTSLTQAPELPAETLYEDCYSYMFQNCTELTQAPELPATTLAYACYRQMFYNCNALTQAPALPATTLADYCYYQMFKGCASLHVTSNTDAEDSNSELYVSSTTGASQWGNGMLPDGSSAAFSTNYYWPSSTGALCFIAQEDGSTVKLRQNGSPDSIELKYSTNKYEWSNYTIDNKITLTSAGDVLYFRASETNLTFSSGRDAYCFQMTGKVAAYGNTMSLLYSDISASNASATSIPCDGCFYKLFSSCKSLITAPSLPALTLKNSCYYGMFEGCTSLKIAPNLPSQVMKDSCYNCMFSNCTSLTTAPKLPATTLANSCYVKMFQGCTALTTAIKLPATTLANSCYQYMFSGCTSLTQAPELSATTLADSCYSSMFNGTKLLPDTSNIDFKSATIVKSGGLKGLFAGTLLTNEKLDDILKHNVSGPITDYSLPVLDLNASCYSRMFSNCSSLTTAPKLPATILADNCYSYMFDGCSSLQTAPALPALTLADNCYSYMFNGCSSLQTAPALPALTLENSCYQYMFRNCASLTDAPSLPALTLEQTCYQFMFENCISLTQTPKLRATALAPYCCYNMFKGCTSLTQAPELPATSLAEECYMSMFNGCTLLQIAPDLPATTMKTSCYSYMFQNCASLTNAPDLPATVLAEKCYKDMFGGCTNIKIASISDAGYSFEWKIPANAGTEATTSDWNKGTISSTTGSYTDTIATGTSYYQKNAVIYTHYNNGNYTTELVTSTNTTLKNPGVPDVAPQTGYTFGGWYVDPFYNTPATFGGKVTGNVSLFAKWDAPISPTPTPTPSYDYDYTVGEVTKPKEEVKKTTDEQIKIVAKEIEKSARSQYVTKNGKKAIQIKCNILEGNTELQKLVAEGCRVEYVFYRSTKKASNYKKMYVSKTGKYTNTKGTVGQRYFYKSIVKIYNQNNELVATTALKDCKYATRIFK